MELTRRGEHCLPSELIQLGLRRPKTPRRLGEMQVSLLLRHTDVRTVTALRSKKELGLPVGEPPAKPRLKRAAQGLCFCKVSPSARAQVRTKEPLSSKQLEMELGKADCCYQGRRESPVTVAMVLRSRL